MTAAIRTSGLTKRFGSRTVVDAVDLDVGEGDRYGFLGPNGSGKTTTVRMLLGLVYPTRGEAEVLGQRIPRQVGRALPDIGALVEAPAAYGHLSARANLRLIDAAGPGGSRRDRTARIEEVLERVGLPGVGRKPVKDYSLGMRQRLGLASALLRRPRLLVLDEPSNGLDPQGIREVRDLLLELNRGGTTIFCSSHLLAEIEQLCTRVGVLDAGRLVLQDDLAALRAPTGNVLVRTPDVHRLAGLLDGRVRSRTGDRAVVAGWDSAALNAELVAAGVRVTALQPEQQTLEDVVLRVTGAGSDRVDGAPREVGHRSATVPAATVPGATVPAAAVPVPAAPRYTAPAVAPAAVLPVPHRPTGEGRGATAAYGGRRHGGSPVGVELRKLLRRPRTWITIGMLAALPTIVAIFLKVTGVGPRPGEGPAFLSSVLANGALFPAAALAIVLPIFLPVAVAVIAGDAVAGEAAGGTLRYLLVRPVGRTRLLVAKLVMVVAFLLLAVVVVAAVGYLVGTRLFGVHPLPSVSGGPPLSTWAATARILLSVAYVAACMLGVASIALFFSTFTDSGLAAALGALAVLVTSQTLVLLDAAASVQPYLPTRYWLAFVDLFRTPILWRDVERGFTLQAVYVGVLLAMAWANFASKDVTS